MKLELRGGPKDGEVYEWEPPTGFIFDNEIRGIPREEGDSVYVMYFENGVPYMQFERGTP